MQTTKTDLHVHTAYSYDGADTPESVCEAALERGVSILALTDHCDMRSHKNGYQCYFPIAGARFAEIETLKMALSGRLTLLNGIELGDVANQPALAREHLAACPYDFVLGSVHHARDGISLDLRSEAPDKLLSIYFDEIDALLDFGDFDSVAHLDYPERYWRVPERCVPQFRDRIQGILKRLAKMGKALEINTSGLFGSLGRVGPEPWVLEDFGACGGRYITLGSDSHHRTDVGRGIEQATAAAQAAGFACITYYRARKPVELPL